MTSVYPLECGLRRDNPRSSLQIVATDDVSRFSLDTTRENVHVVKRSTSLVEPPPARHRLRQRVFRKKLHSATLTHSAQAVPSIGARRKSHRSPKRIEAIVDDRLKRFRMLDPEEFQDMLKSMSQHHSSEQSASPVQMDTIDGIQLESEWKAVGPVPMYTCSLRRLLVTQMKLTRSVDGNLIFRLSSFPVVSPEYMHIYIHQ